MADGDWSLAEAKAKLSEVIDKARLERPQVITRHGKPVAVISSTEDWATRRNPPETLHAFLARSPLRGSGIELERLKGQLRGVKT